MQVIRIDQTAPLEYDVQYRTDFETDKILTPSQIVQLKENFKAKASEDMEINKVEYQEKLMQVYFIRRQILDISAELPGGLQEVDPAFQETTPEGFNVIIKSSTAIIDSTRAVPIVVWYAVSIIATLLTTLFFLRATQKGIFKIIDIGIVHGGQVVETLSRFLIPIGIIAVLILVLRKKRPGKIKILRI